MRESCQISQFVVTAGQEKVTAVARSALAHAADNVHLSPCGRGENFSLHEQRSQFTSQFVAAASWKQCISLMGDIALPEIPASP
jgi:hypothetical protein